MENMFARESIAVEVAQCPGSCIDGCTGGCSGTCENFCGGSNKVDPGCVIL